MRKTELLERHGLRKVRFLVDLSNRVGSGIIFGISFQSCLIHIRETCAQFLNPVDVFSITRNCLYDSYLIIVSSTDNLFKSGPQQDGLEQD